jgi:D-glycero-D-manno-heptose 1,7-bisphosphate phosphatase
MVTLLSAASESVLPSFAAANDQGELDAVFLDRDGVINENRTDHVKSWSEFQFVPGALDAIARFTHAGVRVFVITNQAIINRGLVSPDSVDFLNRRMVQEIEKHGGRVEAVAYCPHRPDEECFCRKPQPGLISSLALHHGVDLGQAVTIGDALSDIEAGLAAGCRAILVLTGRGRDQLARAVSLGHSNFHVATDLSEAAEQLLGRATAVA